MRARLAILLAGAVALGGCAYGYGSGYSPYGGPYGGLSVGVSSGYGGYGYGGGYYGGYGGYGGAYPYGPYGSYTNNIGYPYYGWYDNYYYPGVGTYVYDSYRRPHVWSDSQQRYWSSRRQQVLSHDRTSTQGTHTQATTSTAVRENWSGFKTRDNGSSRTERSSDRRLQHSDSERPR